MNAHSPWELATGAIYRSRTITCDDCGGTGQQHGVAAVRGEYFDAEPLSHDCGGCDGLGEIDALCAECLVVRPLNDDGLCVRCNDASELPVDAFNLKYGLAELKKPECWL